MQPLAPASVEQLDAAVAGRAPSERTVDHGDGVWVMDSFRQGHVARDVPDEPIARRLPELAILASQSGNDEPSVEGGNAV